MLQASAFPSNVCTSITPPVTSRRMLGRYGSALCVSCYIQGGTAFLPQLVCRAKDRLAAIHGGSVVTLGFRNRTEPGGLSFGGDATARKLRYVPSHPETGYRI